MLIIYETLWLTEQQLESFQAVNIHFLSKHIKRRRLQFIWEWVVTNFQIGNLEKSLVVFNALDASLFFFFFLFFLFIFILSLIFFSASGIQPSPVQAGLLIYHWPTSQDPVFLHFLPPQKWLQFTPVWHLPSNFKPTISFLFPELGSYRSGHNTPKSSQGFRVVVVLSF